MKRVLGKGGMPKVVITSMFLLYRFTLLAQDGNAGAPIEVA